MSRDLPSLNAIRTFEAAARYESFSRAAESLNVTQSAVSRQIQLLEQQLGARLFVRNGPRLALTAVGREYRGIVENALATLRRGTARLFGGSVRPGVTLSTVPSLVSRWLIPRLVQFEKQHPDIALRLCPSLQLTDFSASPDIDVAIRYGKGQWPGVVAKRLAEDVVVPVCSPQVARSLRSPHDLARHSLMVEDPHWDLWGHWFAAAGVDIKPTTTNRLSDDFNVQLQAAALGHGIALGRGLLVADDLRAGRLVCPFPIAVTAPVQYYFV